MDDPIVDAWRRLDALMAHGVDEATTRIRLRRHDDATALLTARLLLGRLIGRNDDAA